MKLLLIISQWAPAQTPNTIRWSPLVDYFAAKGHEVHVLTTKRRGISATTVAHSHQIHRAGYNTLLDRLYDLFSSKKRRNELSAGIPSNNPFVLLLEKLADTFWRKNYWPDGSKLFIKPGSITAEKIIAEHQITHIISVGLPYSCHLIAKSMKLKFPKVHWHMDIQDPFSYSKEFWVNNQEKYAQKNHSDELASFNTSDSISVTNEVAQQRYTALFPDAKQSVVIPPVFDPPDPQVEYDPQPYSAKIHLGYAGSFYNGVRSPLAFMQFLSYLHEQNPELIQKIQFHLFGQQDKVSYNILNSFPSVRRYIVLHGFLNRSEVLDALSRLDIIMNFGNTTDYHLPSKVVDYLYLNKPILNLISTENDSTSAFMSRHELELQDLHLGHNTMETNKALFDKFVFQQRKPSIPNTALVSEYTVRMIGDQYLQLLSPELA